MVAEHSLLLRMQHYGSSFTKPLATAWLRADDHNREVLRTGFGHLLARYEHAPPAPDELPGETRDRPPGGCQDSDSG